MSLTKREKRIASIDGREIKSFSSSRAGFMTFINPGMWFSRLHLTLAIRKYNSSLRDSYDEVAHKLDDVIPAKKPETPVKTAVKKYWKRPFALLSKRTGFFNACSILEKWYVLLGDQLAEAEKLPEFKLAPVTTLALFYAFAREEFKKDEFTDKEKFLWTTEIYNTAIAIAEEGLFAGEFGINTIPAALYMTSRLWPDMFTATDATNFINDILLSCREISAKDAAAIRDHISFTYECFLLEGCISKDWRDPIKKWLESYKK